MTKNGCAGQPIALNGFKCVNMVEDTNQKEVVLLLVALFGCLSFTVENDVCAVCFNIHLLKGEHV